MIKQIFLKRVIKANRQRQRGLMPGEGAPATPLLRRHSLDLLGGYDSDIPKVNTN